MENVNKYIPYMDAMGYREEELDWSEGFFEKVPGFFTWQTWLRFGQGSWLNSPKNFQVLNMEVYQEAEIYGYFVGGFSLT